MASSEANCSRCIISEVAALNLLMVSETSSFRREYYLLSSEMGLCLEEILLYLHDLGIIMPNASFHGEGKKGECFRQELKIPWRMIRFDEYRRTIFVFLSGPEHFS